MAVSKTKYDDEKRFSKDNVSLASDFPIKYATFNAYQMRDLIIRKLIEDPATRDQVYPGSNIAILVDLVATMYQTLAYQLNHAASESMFSQSQYYENIVRIAKLLGYNAQGITPSTAMFRIPNAGDLVSSSDAQDISIPPFAYVVAPNGKYYSYCPYRWENCVIPKNLDEGQPYDIVLHNGKWMRYQTIFTPNGSDFETFVLPMVRSELDEQKYASTSHIFAVEVVKKMKDGNPDEVDWTQSQVRIFHPTNSGLFKGLSNQNGSDQIHNFLYNGLGGDDCQVFNVELNEIKQLVLKFGDGITTSKLTPNSELYVFYLETQGMDGGVQPSDDELAFIHTDQDFNIPKELYEHLFGAAANSIAGLKCKVLTSSTSAVREEGVEEIREHAPHWFKMNNRLVTKEDYEFFIMNEPSISGMFNSIKVMNNWEYVATFYRWLHQLGNTSKHNYNPRFYLNPARFTKYGGASLSDAVDSNNVYIWYITNFGDVSDINYDQMVQRCKSMLVDIKDLCHEPVFIPAIPVRCEISSVPIELAQTYLEANHSTTVPLIYEDGSTDGRDASWLEIRINDDYSISSYEVMERICSLLIYFFNVRNRQVGFGSFNTNDIVNLIMEKVPAVSDIYTVWQSGADQTPIYTHGISMATFTTDTSLINLGDDLKIGGGNISLEPFMYPVLYTNTEEELKDRIKVVNKNLNILSRNNY